MSVTLYIAYCEENKSTADHIAKQLDSSNFNMVPLSSQNVKPGEGITHLIAEAGTPGILLLSDNLLKDESCMQFMLHFLQNSSASEKMQIVVVDGQYATGDVETSFDRVSNVIKYMNFWQEKYLELRKQKRSIDPGEEETFNIKLQSVKDISSEIGDFLRLVRNKDFWTKDQLVYNHFELFFKKFSSIAQHQAFVKSVKANPSVSPAPIAVSAQRPEASKEITETSTPATPPVPEAKPLKLVAESMEEISAGIPPVIEKTTMPQAATINEMFQKQNTTNKTVNGVPEVVTEEVLSYSTTTTPPVNTPPTVPTINNIEKEEKDIEEVLQNIDQVSTNGFVEEIDVPESLDVQNTDTVSSGSFQEDLNQVFTEDDVEEILPSNTNSMTEEEEEEFDVMDGVEVEDDADEVEMESVIIEKEDDEDEFMVMDDIEIEEEVEEEDIIIEDLVVSTPSMDLVVETEKALAFVNNGNHQEGFDLFEKVIGQYPENVETRYFYANALRTEANDLEKASHQFEQLIKLDPMHHPSYKALAEISEQNNDFLLAKSYYEKVVNLHPEEQGVYYKLGLITAGFYAEKPKLAAKYFKKAIQQEPKNEDAYYRLGMIQCELLNKNRKALSNFLKTLELNADHPFANYDLALLYHKLEDQKNAAAYYEKAWKINSELKTPENDLAFHYESPEEIAAKAVAAIQQPSPYDNDKVVLITGATSGIGRATAEKFAEHGFRIILTGRRADRLEAIKSDFQEQYEVDVKTLNFDVRNLESVKSMINGLDETWRNIDVLINNAGLAKGFSNIYEGDVEHWDTMIDTNIKGLLYLTRAVAPHMVERKTGHIINVCSTAGKEVYPNGNVYCATKHAVDALTKAMRLDLYKHNIRVGQVSPAHVEETEFAYVRFEDEQKAKIYEDFQPLRSSDVADAIFYIVNTPPHVNVQDILLMGKQQANSNHIDRSGRTDR